MQVKFNLSDNFIKIKNLNYFFCWKIYKYKYNNIKFN